MKARLLASGICVTLILAAAGCKTARQIPQKQYPWEVHDKNRPLPQAITPGETDAEPPSDAIVLFDGSDLSEWECTNGEPARWKVENGYMQIVRRSCSLRTKRSFGDCQLHIEWATPGKVKDSGQGRGNSGVYLMGKYEVQVLDSYNNTTYADGQAAAIYGQSPPMVNASRGPGKWQTYDIVFRRPIFKDEELVRPATITVLHNGVLVQDHWVLEGYTAHKRRAEYKPHEGKLPISLQDHGNPLRYRNIWIRELPEKECQ
ncbi:MAG: 3-keto-disaccharide hydrolase [Planctomycetota bacterium]